MTDSILIFSPNIDGHRQNYVFVIAKILIEAGYRVIIALGGTDDMDAGDVLLIKQLLTSEAVTLVGLKDFRLSHIKASFWVELLTEIEDAYNPVMTIFPTGDEVKQSLKGLGSIKRKPALGRAGIFIYAHHLFRQESPGKGIIKTIALNCLNSYDRHIQNKYFRDTVYADLGIDILITTNRKLVEDIDDNRLHHLPEIYKAWGSNPDALAEIDLIYGQMRTFLESSVAGTRIIYYGSWQNRRGYDDLLRLTSSDHTATMISIGRECKSDAVSLETITVRDRLIEQNRLLELEIPFLPEGKHTDLLFNSCDFVVLPYRDFYGLSGSLVQAISYGKPVIVPNIGWMDWIVRREGIGRVYRHNNYGDLQSVYTLMKSEWHNYAARAQRFANEFTYEKIQTSLLNALNLKADNSDKTYIPLKFP